MGSTSIQSYEIDGKLFWVKYRYQDFKYYRSKITPTGDLILQRLSPVETVERMKALGLISDLLPMVV